MRRKKIGTQDPEIEMQSPATKAATSATATELFEMQKKEWIKYCNIQKNLLLVQYKALENELSKLDSKKNAQQIQEYQKALTYLKTCEDNYDYTIEKIKEMSLEKKRAEEIDSLPNEEVKKSAVIVVFNQQFGINVDRLCSDEITEKTSPDVAKRLLLEENVPKDSPAGFIKKADEEAQTALKSLQGNTELSDKHRKSLQKTMYQHNAESNNFKTRVVKKCAWALGVLIGATALYGAVTTLALIFAPPVGVVMAGLAVKALSFLGAKTLAAQVAGKTAGILINEAAASNSLVASFVGTTSAAASSSIVATKIAGIFTGIVSAIGTVASILGFRKVSKPKKTADKAPESISKPKDTPEPSSESSAYRPGR